MPLDETIENAAIAPKRAKNDSAEVEMHSLKELIETDKYLKGAAANKIKTRGIGFIKFRAGGPVSSIRTKE